MLKLVGTDGDKFYTFPLEEGKFILGRKKSCTFCVPQRTVSGKHAEIEVTDGGQRVFIRDLESRNGTLVNNKAITKRVEIRPGDRLCFGFPEFKLVPQEQESEISVRSTAIPEEDSQHKSVIISVDDALKQSARQASEIKQLIPTISEMARMLVLNEPKEVMLEKSLHLISRLIPCQRLAVLDVSSDQMEFATAASLRTGGTEPGAFQLSRTIVREVMTNRNAVLIGDPTDDPRFASQKSIIMSEMKSAMAVPMLDEDNVLGILYVDTTDPLHRFNNDQVRVLAIFGNILASRLVNLSLISEREEKRVIESELNRASEIQNKLLVRSLPDNNVFDIYAYQEQCRHVGGDLYDVAILPDGRLLFLVADVSGKGIGAALLMSNILAAFRILYADDNFDLARAVRRVSVQMFRYTEPDVFATLFIGLADPESGKVKYVNAGHNPPLLVRADGRVEDLSEAGLVIGAVDFAEWSEVTIDCSPGDALVVFSDGVTEAEGPSGQYGEERLQQVVMDNRSLTPEELKKSLLKDIGVFVADEPQSDDITIMILKRKA